jgi:L-ascorbate metabolism protein UlaG (beta-lactamase superfamily)
MFKAFGKNPFGEYLTKVESSPNFKNGAFQNLSDTPMFVGRRSTFKLFLDFFFNAPKNSKPPGPLPFVKTDLNSLQEAGIVWFGHSSYFLRINGKNILVDPVFSGNASPFSFMVGAFKGSNEYGVEQMPDIDLLILTHDHFDHLDYKTVVKLNPKVKNIFCSLGVKSHLDYWGIKNNITEFDWCDSKAFENMQIIAAPARHFSGRTTKRGQTLWSSFVLRTDKYNLYLGGDSGYDTHFIDIGNQFGPFDMAILECGQYNTLWPYIHMMPEETAQAAIDLKAKTLLPVHWSKFALSFHAWNEPIIRVTKKAKELKLPVTTPMIGEPVIINKSYPDKVWWE